MVSQKNPGLKISISTPELGAWRYNRTLATSSSAHHVAQKSTRSELYGMSMGSPPEDALVEMTQNIGGIVNRQFAVG